MKTSLNTALVSTPKFPRLRRCTESTHPYTVLFVNDTTGMVVQADPRCCWPVGDYSDSWATEDFMDVEHTTQVVLQND